MPRILVFCALFISTLFSFPSFGLAQENGAGIGLKPATIEERMDPGQVKQFTVAISNVSNADQLYYLYKRDIVGVKDGGVPEFAKDGLQKTGFELSEWIALEGESIAIPKGEERSVSFIITVPDNASPGSHFGGIFVSAEPPKMRESGAAIGYEVANIVSIRVAGDAVESAQIRQFSTDNYIYGKPVVSFSAKIENGGNTLIRPHGTVKITNMLGKDVANIDFNNELAGVFPGTTREFNFVWENSSTLFGRYEAMLSTSYGEEGFKQTVFSTVTFWILPMNIILPALGTLAVLLLVTYFGVRLYVRNKLAYYGAVQGGRRLVRRRKETSSSAFLLVLIVMFSVTALFVLLLLAFFA